MTNLAGTFVRLGLKPAEAVKQAAAAVKKTSVTYNGVLLNLQGLDVPENFAESVDAAVADFAAKSPRMIERNGVDVSDIAIAPASSGDASGGRFVMIDGDTMLPLLDDNGRAAYISLRGLRRDARSRKDKTDRKAVENAALHLSGRQNGMVQAVDTDGKSYWVKKETREIFAPSFGAKDSAVRWKPTGKRYGRAIMTASNGLPVLNGTASHAVDAVKEGVGAYIEHQPLRYLWDAVKDGTVRLGPVTIGQDAFPDD